MLLSLTGCSKYDLLVQRDEECMKTWSDYESQLQRRSDLIPNLVATVQAAAKNENQILKDVMEARAKATQVTLKPTDFENPEKMKEFANAQSSLGGALSRLMVVQEAYPNLKTNENFLSLQAQVEGTENRLNRARTVYNDSVASYNLELRRVSGKVINPITGMEFKPRAYFKSDDVSKTVPVIGFK